MSSPDTPPLPSGQSTIDASQLGRKPRESSRRYLFVVDGESTRMVSLEELTELTIGRAETAGLQLHDASVSRMHARLSSAGGKVRIEDLDSQNGTLVNDEKLSAARTLTSGDVITLSGVTLVFHQSGDEPATPKVIEMAAFRQRTQAELERALAYFRPFSVLCAVTSAPVDRARAALALEPRLRRLDVAAWQTTDTLMVALPELAAPEATELALDLAEALQPFGATRLGIASCPADGIELDTLLSSAREAARSAKPGQTGLAGEAFRSLKLGQVEVVIADPVMVRLYGLIERLAKSELPVLVYGETGTGKELAAQAIHEQSPRKGQPLVTVNCAALQENLLESELFGHEKGAFTGADRTKVGLLETANGGTVFLDELGELSLAIQAKLLRVLESRKVQRVGDTKERPVDIRVVAATNRDLEAEVKAGRFRQDLMFRLNAASLCLPPLRDRARELPILARAFLAAASASNKRVPMAVSDQAMQTLSRHRWPGNVRELKNVMEFVAATAAEDTVEPWHLESRLGTPTAPAPTPDPMGQPSQTSFRPIQEEVQALERSRMLQALNAVGWNQTRAAEAISMPLRTFVTKLKQFDLGRERPAGLG